MIELPGEDRYATVAGIKTHYVAAGSGPPLILIHGLGASVVTWRDNIGPLSEAFRVFALDLPGHGDSEKPDIDYAADRMVRFMVSFTEELRLERPAIIGSSVGGTLGLMMALEHPKLVSKLVLVDSPALGREVSVYLRLVSIPGLGELLESSKLGGTRLMLQNVFYDRAFVTPELLDELCRTREMPGAKEAVVRVIRNTVGLRGVRERYVLRDQLKRLESPLMMVWGAEDRIVPAAHAYEAGRAAPGAVVRVFDRCGHWPHMEMASEFNAVVLGFLSD